MTVTLQPVFVETGSNDREGCLVFTDGRLAAVLVRLSEQHADLAGQWHYEHGFGPLEGPTHPVFETLDAAQDWIRQRLNQTRRQPPPLPPVIGEP
jgi:hypothetical protein